MRPSRRWSRASESALHGAYRVKACADAKEPRIAMRVALCQYAPPGCGLYTVVTPKLLRLLKDWHGKIIEEKAHQNQCLLKSWADTDLPG